MHFSELFTVNFLRIKPKVTVSIDGITVASGSSFIKWSRIGSFDLSTLVNKELEIEVKNDGVHIINGWYN